MTLHVSSWSTTELDVIRVGLGFVVIRAFSRIPSFRPAGKLLHPVGIARVVDISWVASRSTSRYMQYGAYIAALCYAADVLVPVALLYLTGATVVELTYQSSHGSVNHSRHLLATVLTAQTAAIFVWNAAEQGNWDLGGILSESQQATATWWAIEAIIAVYFTSGLSKLINTGVRWAGRSNRLLLAAYGRVETDRMTGKVDPGVSDRAEMRISWLFDRPFMAKCMFTAALCLELATPIGLSGQTALIVTGLGLIALHWGNQLLLRISFTEFSDPRVHISRERSAVPPLRWSSPRPIGLHPPIHRRCRLRRVRQPVVMTALGSRHELMPARGALARQWVWGHVPGSPHLRPRVVAAEPDGRSERTEDLSRLLRIPRWTRPAGLAGLAGRGSRTADSGFVEQVTTNNVPVVLESLGLPLNGRGARVGDGGRSSARAVPGRRVVAAGADRCAQRCGVEKRSVDAHGPPGPAASL